MDVSDDFLGRGWSFPPTFNKNEENESHVVMVAAKEDIDQSLHILLSTSLGERILQPLYGCDLKEYQFEPLSSTLIGFIKNTVENALLYFEARIQVDNISISDANSEEAINGYLRIGIDYTIRTTNSRYNFVYKFYLQEASNDELFQLGKV
jgi:phage baseplate assembly protein W